MDTAIVVVAKYFLLASIAIDGLAWLRLPAYQKRTLTAAGITGGLAGLGLIALAGALYNESRPFDAQPIHPLFTHAADNGFPSDHAALTMFIAVSALHCSWPWAPCSPAPPASSPTFTPRPASPPGTASALPPQGKPAGWHPRSSAGLRPSALRLLSPLRAQVVISARTAEDCSAHLGYVGTESAVLQSVTRRVGLRRDAADPGRGPWPDQKHGARRVVDHETGRRAKALGSETGPVAISGRNEQVGSIGCRHDFTLDRPVTLSPGTRHGHAAGGISQQFRCGLGGQRGDACSRVMFRVAAASHACVGAVGSDRNVRGGDVEQDDPGARGEYAGSVDAGAPGAFGNPDDDGHARRVLGRFGLDHGISLR